MDVGVITVILLALLFALLGLGVWVFVSLLVVAVVGVHVFTTAPVLGVLGQIAWNSVDSWSLAALPLFIFMGELLFRSRISERLFEGISPWIGRLPGGLLHTNVVASSLFAAISGSSVATAATIGKINVPELKRRNYSERLTLGSLAGAGTLGFLIPPSIMLIIYGVLAEVSIGQLFIGGIVPGALLALGFMLFLGVVGALRPDLAPPPPSYSWRNRLRGLVDILPVALLIVAVLGSIYAGIATPTESAAIGVLGAFLLALAYRTLTPKNFMEAVLGSVRTTCMIGMIIVGAAVLSTAMGYLGIPRTLASWVVSLDLGAYVLILVLAVFYLMLGLFLDGISMIVVTLPITLPIVTAVGFDPLWFGVFLVLMVEAAQITPPVGLNLFVLSGISGKSVGYIAVAAIPFFLILILITAVITAFPDLVLYLPRLM
ncbi:MAG: TRAP transporter large permease subunit [Trueperaceae bacterium]